MYKILLILFFVFSCTISTEYTGNRICVIEFNSIVEAQECKERFYSIGIWKDIISQDNYYYIEIENDEFNLLLDNGERVIKREWQIVVFYELTVGETRIGKSIVN